MVYIELPPEVEGSTGPATPARPHRPKLSPKREWRREGLLKHLVEPTVVAETAGLLEQQTRAIHSAFQPRNEWQDWLTSTIATIMLRINRCERIERKLRDWASYRAIDFWEEDQKLAVETIALKIAKEPTKVVVQLRATPAGIEWLLGRWRLLARVEPRDWTESQRDLAALLTAHDSTLDLADAGLVLSQIAELEARREEVLEADALARGLVEADLNDDAVPNLARLRRHVRSLQRQLKWYIDQFHVEHPDRWDDPRRRPAIDGPVVEAFRPPNPNHFEGVPVPEFGGTNPTAAAPPPTLAETEPERDDPAPAISETKPIESTSGTKTPATNFAIEPPPFVADYALEKGRHHSRALKAGEHSREYVRREKAARRRTNLALAELI